MSVGCCVHCAGAMNSIGGGAVGGSNGCAASAGAVGGTEAMQQYGASAGAGLSGLLNPGMLCCVQSVRCCLLMFTRPIKQLIFLIAVICSLIF